MKFYKKYRALKAQDFSDTEYSDFIEEINSDEGRSIIEQEIENDWNFLDAKETTDKVRLDSILTKITTETKSEARSIQKFAIKKFSGLKIAALITILMVFGIYGYILNYPPNQPGLIVKSTPIGQKSTFFLPDGSKVYLNAESVISFPAEFSADNRIVQLSGEAFFEVTKNANKAFIVQSGDYSTTALGTSFNVQAYIKENKVEVALSTGQVVVESPHNFKKVYLLPGKKVTFLTKDHSIIKSNFDNSTVIGWKDGLIKFSQASFVEVKLKLERWYGVSISYNGKPPSDWAYTGEFDNQSLKNILDGMKLTKNFDYTLNKKSVEIKFN